MRWTSIDRVLRLVTGLFGLSLASVMTGSVVAEEGATRMLGNGTGLVQACREEHIGGVQPRGGPCSSYLFGYLDGNAEVALGYTMPSAFMQNVMRTRAPSHPQIKAMKSVVYCLDSMENLSTAIAALEPEAVATKTSAQVVVAILDRDHRCRT